MKYEFNNTVCECTCVCVCVCFDAILLQDGFFLVLFRS